MAITWDITVLSVTDASTGKRVRLQFARTDDTPDPPSVWTTTVASLIDTRTPQLITDSAKKAADAAWAMWQAHLNRQAALAQQAEAIVSGMEDYLEAKEGS